MDFAPLRQQRGRSPSSSVQSYLDLKPLLLHSLGKELPNKLDLAEGGWGLEINLQLRPVVSPTAALKITIPSVLVVSKILLLTPNPPLPNGLKNKVMVHLLESELDITCQ